MVAINRKRTRALRFHSRESPQSRARTCTSVPHLSLSPPSLSLSLSLFLSLRRGMPPFISSAYPPHRRFVPPERRVRDDAKDEGRRRGGERSARAFARPRSGYTAPLVPVRGLYGAAPACRGCLPVAGFSTRRAARVFSEKKRKKGKGETEKPCRASERAPRSTTWWISIERLSADQIPVTAEIAPVFICCWYTS